MIQQIIYDKELREQARRSQPSDSESDSDSETEDAPIIKAEPQDEEEEGEYSPGGGDTAYSAYEPAPTEKPSKPYRPGGFFYDDDDEDELRD